MDYLIAELEKTDKTVTYLLDVRCRGDVANIKKSNLIIFQKAGLTRRKKFYKRHKCAFTTVFCLGNLPPNIPINATVYTYFHNFPFICTVKEFSLLKNLFFEMKRRVVKSYRNHTDYWIVQTGLMKKLLSERYRISDKRILTLPFYLPFVQAKTQKKEIGLYIYVSLGLPYKNHLRLIEAFCNFYDKHKFGKLVLTVPSRFRNICDLLAEKITAGYPLENMGYVPRESLQTLYERASFHVFPSLAESLGLGIIESIDCGCKVIGANLPYMYEACVPSLIFDPLDVNSMEMALEQSMQQELPNSESQITNHIHAILDLLQ